MASTHVITRSGRKERVDLSKIQARLERAACDIPGVDPLDVAVRVVAGLHDGCKTRDLDRLAAEEAASRVVREPAYDQLAVSIAVSGLHKDVPANFSDVVANMAAHVDAQGVLSPLVSERLVAAAERHGVWIDAALRHDRDFGMTYFGFRTLERSYLLTGPDGPMERPQHVYARVALELWEHDVERALETYEALSSGQLSHASPTMFNAGTPHAQMSSCFLVKMRDDSIEGIYRTLSDCAAISKFAGGIGLSVHDVRAQGTPIRGTNGRSNGLCPMLRVFNESARYVDQGGGKRKGAIAIYLEPWHADVLDVLELKKATGSESVRARDLFFGLWVPDEFMRRVEADESWSLFCPTQAAGLADVHGEAFDELYRHYEERGLARQTLPARELWDRVMTSQIETGGPYVLYKDSCNARSNQRHLGTIQSSNLCSEIVEYTAEDETAVCNLASLALPRFVREEGKSAGERLVGSPGVGERGKRHFDFIALHAMARLATRNLDRVVTLNRYPTPEARRSNERHRPIGLGVQGLADVFLLLGYTFDSPEAQRLNVEIFETIYHASVTESAALAAELGAHPSFEGSPASEGVLQPDLWGATVGERWDWDAAREAAKAGMRNSLLVALMPTASTSQILGWNECIEPYTANLYVRHTLAGEHFVFNRHLIADLCELGIYDENMRRQLLATEGSIATEPRVPEKIRKLYRTVWEMKQKPLVDLMVDRAPFVDQHQSFNVFLEAPTKKKVAAMHAHAWKRGAKGSLYYLRTRAATNALKFSLGAEGVENKEVCQIGCDSCGA